MQRTVAVLFILCTYISLSLAQHDHDHNGSHDHNEHQHDAHHGHDHAGHDHSAHGKDADHAGHADPCGAHHGPYDPTNTAFHHIGDANVYSIGPINIPLPCMLHSSQDGWSFFSSSIFHADGHGTGSKAHRRYVLFEGLIRRVQDQNFPYDTQDVCVYSVKSDGKETVFVRHQGRDFVCENKSTADGGLFGGSMTSFMDFSITKNVVGLFLVFVFMAWMFIGMAKKYKNNPDKAPSGLQGLIEPIFIFIQDEVAKPFLGHKWEKYLPFLMSLFFFILGLNLFGQIPFLGATNVTGNLSFTLVLAVFAFLVTNLSGNGHYWEHIFNMPGVPFPVKLILTPVEILGVFIKPITLMLRLFANITAGHMVILSFIGLIFIFGQSGENIPGTLAGITASAPLTIFMMTLELLIAFIQAFVFTILTASYIGAAIEDGH